MINQKFLCEELFGWEYFLLVYFLRSLVALSLVRLHYPLFSSRAAYIDLISCPAPLGSAWRCLLCASLRVGGLPQCVPRVTSDSLGTRSI